MKKLLPFVFYFAAATASGQVITTVAGNGTWGFSGDGGQAIFAQLADPAGVAADAAGNIYIGDTRNNRIRKVNAAGIISTFAGTGLLASGTSVINGVPATAVDIGYPGSLAVDISGNVYLADGSFIRKIDAAGMLSTIAGTGTSTGISGDGGPATAAEIFPSYLIVDNIGNIYFTDIQKIRKINTSGIISTIAGTGTAGYSGDGGPATAANIKSPRTPAVDAGGNMYFCDYDNHRVRKIDAAGIITTIAGNGIIGFSGDGGAATAASLHFPSALAADYAGNLFVGDTYNARIRKVTPTGTITTYAGNGTAGYSGDGGQALLANINTTDGDRFATDPAGNLYFTDHQRRRIRKVSGTLGLADRAADPKITIFPNPNNGSFTMLGESRMGEKLSIQIMDACGNILLHKDVICSSNTLNEDVSLDPTLASGLYIIRITSGTQATTIPFTKL